MVEFVKELFASPMAYFHAFLILSMGAMVYRFLAGPTEYDRLAAFECFVIAFLTFVAMQVVELRKDWILDFILVMSIVGYLSTVALAEFQGIGELPDPERASVVFGDSDDDDDAPADAASTEGDAASDTDAIESDATEEDD